jgi:MraZ protein
VLRLDSKGRVSIPAAFRAVLTRDGFDGLYCYPALDQPAIDAGGNALMAEIEALIANQPLYSAARENLALALYGTS